MKDKNIFICVLNRIWNNDLWSFVRSHVFILALLSFAINLSCENSNSDALKPKTNSPPVITSVKMLPERPNVESKFDLFVQSQDPDKDPITYYYQWLRNDEEIFGENNNSLKSGNFKKGDMIQVKVTPSDGKVNGAPFLSSPVKVLNSPPFIQEVWIEPKVAYVTDQLKTNVINSDPDGDFIYYTYQWEKNGVVLNEERGEVLERGQFKKGDLITLTIIPDDRESLGKAKRSNHIIIANSPPIIVSSPATSAEKTTYIYQVKANDSDDDPIRFTLKSGPKGMEIDGKTGLIRWEIRKEDKGSHSVEIEISDDAGARSIQRYTLKVDFR